jgi:hypothetical protein
MHMASRDKFRGSEKNGELPPGCAEDRLQQAGASGEAFAMNSAWLRRRASQTRFFRKVWNAMCSKRASAVRWIAAQDGVPGVSAARVRCRKQGAHAVRCALRGACPDARQNACLGPA